MELPNNKPIFKKPQDADNKKAKPNVEKNNANSEIIVNKNVKGILPSTVLSQEDKAKMDDLKIKKQKIAYLLKQITTILGITVVLWFIFVKANISENNSLLSKAGIDENLGKYHQEISKKNLQLEMDNYELDKQVKEFERKIENKYYTLFSENIKNIKDNQITWFDRINKNNELFLGAIDGVRRVSKYFNDSSYSDPTNIITGAHEKVEINSIRASREGVSFSINTTQILGRIIFMDVEIVDILNSFPIYKNGQHLSSFSRDKNDDGDYFTEFSLNLELQLPGEEDSNDSRFIEYLDWLRKKSPNIKIQNYQNNN